MALLNRTGKKIVPLEFPFIYYFIALFKKTSFDDGNKNVKIKFGSDYQHLEKLTAINCNLLNSQNLNNFPCISIAIVS